MICRTSKLLICFALCFLPMLGSTHARLSPDGALEPRSTRDNIKQGPCGVPRGNTLTVFEPGETIEVAWEMSIYHQGVFRIAFSPANDKDFDKYVLVDNIPDVKGQNNRKAMVTLPDMTCEGCTLQLIQTMPDKKTPSNYFSCANIALREKAKPLAPTVNMVVSSSEGDSVIIKPDTGPVSVVAQLMDNGMDRVYVFDWSASDSRLTDIDGGKAIFAFDPAVLAAGEYVVAVDVIDNEYADIRTTKSLTFSVLEEEPMTTVAGRFDWTWLLVLLFFPALLSVKKTYICFKS